MTKEEYFERLRRRWTHDNLRDAALMTFIASATDDADADRQLRASGQGTLARMLRAGVLRPDMWVYEIGCGVGRAATELADYLTEGQYVGVELTDEYVQLCRARCPRGRFYATNGYEFPLPDESADLVVEFSVCCHMPLQQVWRWLLEIKRVLKPDGRAYLQFHNLSSEKNWADFVKSAANWTFLTDPEKFQMTTEETYSLLIDRAGFAVTASHNSQDPDEHGEPDSWFVILRKF